MATTITDRLIGAPTLAGALTDLAAIEELSGTGVLERTGANTWALRLVDGGNAAWSPQTADGLALGTSELPWADLFLSVGGVLDWGNGDVTITHAANALTFAGAGSGYVFDAPLKLPSGSKIDFAGGDVLITHAANALSFAGASSGYAFDVAPNVGGSVVALLATENQALSGGVAVAVKDLGTRSSGTLTLDMGDRPLQKYVNNGSHTLSPGTVKGSCLVSITNGASAGAITTSNWSHVAGDSFDTTDGDKFLCHCTVDDDGSILIVQARQ